MRLGPRKQPYQRWEVPVVTFLGITGLDILSRAAEKRCKLCKDTSPVTTNYAFSNRCVTAISKALIDTSVRSSWKTPSAGPRRQ